MYGTTLPRDPQGITTHIDVGSEISQNPQFNQGLRRDIFLNSATAYVDPRAMKEQRLESLRAGSLMDALDDDLPGETAWSRNH